MQVVIDDLGQARGMSNEYRNSSAMWCWTTAKAVEILDGDGTIGAGIGISQRQKLLKTRANPSFGEIPCLAHRAACHW